MTSTKVLVILLSGPWPLRGLLPRIDDVGVFGTSPSRVNMC